MRSLVKGKILGDTFTVGQDLPHIRRSGCLGLLLSSRDKLESYQLPGRHEGWDVEERWWWW